MFFSKKNGPENNTHIHGDPTPTDEPTDTPEDVRPKSLAEEINDRLAAVKKYSDDFITDAVKRGVSDAELPILIADAMNAGVFPRIASGVTRRTIVLLDGRVIPEALEVHTRVNDEGIVRSSIFSDASMLSDELSSEGEDRPMGIAPMHIETDSDRQTNLDMLAKIDAHMSLSDESDKTA